MGSKARTYKVAANQPSDKVVTASPTGKQKSRRSRRKEQTSQANLEGHAPARSIKSFPFFGLPGEIRITILKYYFGARKIHIVNPSYPQPYPYQLAYRICVANDTFIEPCDRKHPRAPVIQQYGEKHWNCDSSEPDPVGPRDLDLGLFQVNKQLFKEASAVFWRAQTFDFTMPDDLARFCRDMSYRPVLKKLELSRDTGIHWARDGSLIDLHDECSVWPMSPNVMRSLEGVADLVLTYALGVGFATPDNSKGHTVTKNLVQFFHRAVRYVFGQLRALEGLKNVTVDIKIHDERYGGCYLDPAYLPVLNAAFEAELMSPLGNDYVQADKDEDAWQDDIYHTSEVLEQHDHEMFDLVNGMEEHQEYKIRAQRSVEAHVKVIEDSKAEGREPDEKQEKTLAIHRKYLQQNEETLLFIREKIVEEQKFDRTAHQERVELLRQKIGAHETRIYQYLSDFDRNRGKDESGTS